MKLSHLYRLNLYLLLGGLLSVPASLIYQMRLSRAFAEANPDANCSWVGLLFAFLAMGFVYLLGFLGWNLLLGKDRSSGFWNWLQFVLIFLLGAIPAMLIAYIGFTSK